MKHPLRSISLFLVICLMLSLMPPIRLQAAAEDTTDMEIAEMSDIPETEVLEGTAPTPAPIEEPDSEALTAESFSYTIDSHGNAAISKYTGTDTEIVVPAELDGHPVTSIAQRAFEGNQDLVSVELPDSISSIGYRAFYNCTALADINCPRALTSTAKNIFTGCVSLKHFAFPADLTTIPAILSDVDYVETIELPKALTELPTSAFSGCTALTQIDIPDTVTKIGSGAFYNCTSLTSVTLPDGLTELGSQAFHSCTALHTVNYPHALQITGKDIFANCSSLTSFAFPDDLTSITTILEGANCVQSIVLPSALTVIPDSAFMNCRKLTNISIPNTVTSIGEFAFSVCLALPSITIPDSVTKIGYSAFSSCYALSSVTLPAGLAAIPNNAFDGCKALSDIVIPDSVTQIGSRAFYGCTSLTTLALPRGLSKLGEIALFGCSRLTAYCDYATPALLDIIEQATQISVTGSLPNDGYLDRSRTKITVNLGSATANGYVPITVDYAAAEGVSVSCLRLFLPANSVLVESTLTLDGVLCTDYNYQDDRYLEVYTTQSSGQLKLMVDAERVTSFLGYAALKVTANGASKYALVDLFNEKLNLLTINVPEVLANDAFTASGVAPASAQIALSVNGIPQTTVTATKGGSWSADLTLPNAENYYEYTVTAACSGSEQTVRTTYIENDAVMTSFVMSYIANKHPYSVELINDSNVKPMVYFVPGCKFDFEVRFDHPEQIDTLYVTSTRNNVTHTLETVYDESKGAFVTDGYFVPEDPNYVPGVLNVEYHKKAETFTVSDEVDWAAFDAYTAIVPDSAVSVTDDNAKSFSTSIDMSAIDEAFNGITANATVSVYDPAKDGSMESWMGDISTMTEYILPGGDGKSIAYMSTFEDADTVILIVKDASGSEAVKLYVESWTDNPNTPTGMAEIADNVDSVSQLNLFLTILYDQVQITKDMHDLREEVRAQNYENPSDRDEALRQVDILENDQRCVSVLLAILPVVVMAGGPMIGAALLFSAGLTIISLAAPFCWEWRSANIKNGGFRVSFCIDPSGYVYDIDTNERIEGVKATAYCIEYDDSDNFWNNKPTDDMYGTMWNAAEYDQANPLYTNADGKYAWDVPEGWWRVKYEKEGYETTWSWWMPVPPIQTEVNIGMKYIGGTVTPTPTPISNPFIDVAETDYFYDSVMWAVENDVTTGTSPNTFSPAAPCTRAQVVTFLWRANGSPKPTATQNSFVDVSSADYFYEAVLWAVENKVTSGTSSNTFSPKDPCTRAQVATFLWRARGEPTVSNPDNPFFDVPNGQYYYNAVLWAVENKVTSGIGKGQFAPDAICTRAQIATFLYRALA